MSFAKDCKEELVRIRLPKAEARMAQLSGLTYTAAALRLGRTPSLAYHTENQTVAKHIASLATSLYRVEAVIERKEQEHRKTPLYAVILSGEDGGVLCEQTGAYHTDPAGIQIFGAIPNAVISNEECCRAFLRGCFLGSGTCVDPVRRYHLELVLRSEPLADRLLELLHSVHVSAKKSIRKERYIVYLKDGDAVMGFLAYIGANVSAMQFENVRVEKDMRNYVNRTSNCETANIEKQVVSSLKQQKAIRTIEKHRSVKDLPPSLQEAAMLRIAHPNATLQELAELAGIQKSGMNHRLTRLIKLAEELEQE